MSAKNWTFVTSKQVWMDRSLSFEAKAIWHILSAWRDHKTGKAHPKMWTLEQVSGMGRPRVRRAVAELIKAGAITRETIPWRTKTGVSGTKHVYTISKLSDWVGRDVYTASESEILSRQVSDASGSELVRIGPPISKPSTDNNPSTTNNPFSPARPVTTYSLSESEIEALVADRGLGASVASVVWERLCSAAWRDKAGLPFTSRRNLEAYAAGLAETINAARSAPAAKQAAQHKPAPPVSQFSKVYS